MGKWKLSNSYNAKKISFILTIAVFLLSSYLFLDAFLKTERSLSPEFSGSVVAVETSQSSPANVFFDKTGEYVWVVPEPASISSLRLSGEFEDKGFIKILVEREGERYLIFDSSKRGEGFEEPALEEIPQDISTLEELEKPITEETNLTERIPEGLNITEEGYVGTITEEKKPKKIKFSSVCEATCQLEGFNQSFYRLIFEVSNTEITVDSIQFGIKEKINTADRIDILNKEGKEIGFHKVTERPDGKYDVDIDFDFSTGLTALQAGQAKPKIKING